MTQREVDRIMKKATKLFVSGLKEEAEILLRSLLERLKKENWKKKS